MYLPSTLSYTLLALSLSAQVYGHGAMVLVSGANGVKGQGFGIDTSTPRDGTKRNPFQQDTSIIRDNEIQSGKAGVCGRTLEGGNNDVEAQMQAAGSGDLPSASADGTVSMTIHQVNGDGAGPYTCEVSADGTGQDFAAMTVTTNVPGKNSRSRAKATDFALVAQMPAGTTCSGGPNGNACLVRCRNGANAGPFGGCVAVTDANSGNSTASATTAAAAAEETESTASTAASTAESSAASGKAKGKGNDAAAAAAEETESTASTAASTAESSAASGKAKGKGNDAAAAAADVADDVDDEDDEDDDDEEDDSKRRRWINSRIVGRSRFY